MELDIVQILRFLNVAAAILTAPIALIISSKLFKSRRNLTKQELRNVNLVLVFIFVMLSLEALQTIVIYGLLFYLQLGQTETGTYVPIWLINLNNFLINSTLLVITIITYFSTKE